MCACVCVSVCGRKCCCLLLKQSLCSAAVVSRCVREEEPISDQDTEVESTVVGPGCMQDPWGVVRTVPAASLGTVEACQDTGAP